MEKIFKQFHADVKLADEGEPDGTVKCVFSTFNVVDRDGDVVLPSALKDGTPIRMSSWGHKWGELPVGKGVIRVTPEQALFEGQFFLQTEAGRETYETVKALGDLQEWSWGFSVLPGGKRKGDFGGKRVNLISAVEPFEVSPVLVGSNPQTQTVSVKAEGDVPMVPGAPGGGGQELQDFMDAKAIKAAIAALIATEAGEDDAEHWSLGRLVCALGDLDCFIMSEGHDAMQELVGHMGQAPDVSKLSAQLRRMLHAAGYDVVKGATEDEREAQAARAEMYGIGAQDGGNVAKLGLWADLPDGEFGDPVNYRYPMPDLAHANNALSQLTADTALYAAAEQDTVRGRIEARQVELRKDARGEAVTASYAEQGNALLASAEAFTERSRSLADLRAKEGRVLSTANRGRLGSLVDAMKTIIADIEGLLVETGPQQAMGDGGKGARERAFKVAERRARVLA